MNLDELIIACFCVLDDLMPSVTGGKRLRQRGPLPKLAESEVLTMGVVGTYLGLSQNKALFASFQQHYRHFFPALAGVHRTTFVRQSANLWAIKERLWCLLRDQVVRHDWSVGIIDSMPVPVYRFARASWCVRSLIDTVCGQLTDRCHLKRVWARDLWHLRNCVLRAVLMHTLCFWFNQHEQALCLQFDRLGA